KNQAVEHESVDIEHRTTNEQRNVEPEVVPAEPEVAQVPGQAQARHQHVTKGHREIQRNLQDTAKESRHDSESARRRPALTALTFGVYGKPILECGSHAPAFSRRSRASPPLARSHAAGSQSASMACALQSIPSLHTRKGNRLSASLPIRAFSSSE